MIYKYLTKYLRFETMNAINNNDNNNTFSIPDGVVKAFNLFACDLAGKLIGNAAEAHGFDFQAELSRQGFELDANGKLKMKVVRVKTPKFVKEMQAKKNKVNNNIIDNFPFCTDLIDGAKCQAITFAGGLFKQCTRKPAENTHYCKSCEDGGLKCGVIADRFQCPGPEYTDKTEKGRKPINYLKYLEKHNISLDSILSRARELNVNIHPGYLIPEEKKVSQRGRPKKNADVICKAVTDTSMAVEQVFNQLKSQATDDEYADAVEPPVADEKKKHKKVTISAEDKEREKAEKAAAKEREKAEKAAAKEREKAEKAAAKEREKAEKAASKAAPAAAPAAPVEQKQDDNVDEEDVQTTKIKIGKVTYHMTTDGKNVLYDRDGDYVGVYNPITKEIEQMDDDDDDEVDSLGDDDDDN
jgi:hypothetical protein